MKFKVAQVIGLNTDQKAAQVISDSRDGENYFFAVLDLSSDDAFTRGRQILSDLSDFYFDQDGGTDGEKLTLTFEEAKKKLGTDEFSLLLATTSSKVLYFISLGEVEVYLKRLEKVSALNVGTDGQLISGFLQEGDRMLFLTKSLTQFLGEDLNKSLELPLDSFEEAVTDRVGTANIESQGLGLAALLVDVEGVKEAAPEESEATPVLEQERFDEQQTAAEISGESKPNPLKSVISFILSKRSYFPKSNRGRLILAAILILAIGLGVGFNIKAKKDAKLQSDFNNFLQLSKEDFNSAKGLSTLNPPEAKSRLDRAKVNVDSALKLKPKDSEAQSLKQQIENDSSSILQQFSVSEFPLFLDLDLIKKNLKVENLSLSNGRILLLDSALKTLATVDLSKKSNQVLAGSEQLGQAMYSSLNGESAFVYSEDKGVLKVDTTNQKASVVSKKDETLGAIVDIYGFGGNVYLLDSSKNQIWKYLPTEQGYSDKREYLNKTTKANFKDAKRMQIESSVYVLKRGGEIERFTRGDKDHFSFEGLPSPIKDPKSFFVSSDTDNLYLLDSGNSRLLILSKTGVYKGEVNGSKFASSSDLVVDEKGKKVYLLEGSKIYTFDLK